MRTNEATLPVRKIDRSAWGNDMMAVEVRATEVIAGDLVPGLGRVDAILTPGLAGHGHDVLLCSGDDALAVKWFDEVTVHGAICSECDMHPDDCDYYGCDNPDSDA